MLPSVLDEEGAPLTLPIVSSAPRTHSNPGASHTQPTMRDCFHFPSETSALCVGGRRHDVLQSDLSDRRGSSAPSSFHLLGDPEEKLQFAAVIYLPFLPFLPTVSRIPGGSFAAQAQAIYRTG